MEISLEINALYLSNRHCYLTNTNESHGIYVISINEIMPINSYLRPYDDRKLSNSFTEKVNGKLRTYLSISREISNFSRFRKRVIYSLSKDVQYSLNNSLHSDSVPKRKRGTYKKIRE